MADSQPYNILLSPPRPRRSEQPRYDERLAAELDARLEAPVKAPFQGFDLERFRAALLIGALRPAHGCWVWQRGTGGSGYGLISFRSGRRLYAHRAAWFIAHGPLPADCPLVLHDCDNMRCVRPSHLYAGTPADNSRDMSRRGRARNRVVPRQVTRAALEELMSGGDRAEIAQRLIDGYGITRSAAYYHLRPALLACAQPAAAQ